MENPIAQQVLDKVIAREAVVGIIGLGYVGLPLAIEFAKAGFPVIGFDLDQSKVDAIEAGKSFIKHIPDDHLAHFSGSDKCHSTVKFEELATCDAIIICVPTPLTKNREPDVSYIISTSETIAKFLRPGQLITLESTTYPGTTREIMQPILEAGGLKSPKDFFLAYSPEREDPGNPNFSTGTIPKVVGGLGEDAQAIACELYNAVVVETIPVSSPDAAEATKLLENIYRSVNIALVNELKVVFDKMDIDIWEVVNAAKTKPFGYKAFYPGPGLGGHCIPIDPFYLTWKAREYGVATRFIELAGEVNTSMPDFVIAKVAEALNGDRKSINGSKILVLGLAYKPNVDDMRESPTFVLMEKLIERGAIVDYNDPHVPVVPPTREHAHFTGWASKQISEEYDLLLVSTDHSEYKSLDLSGFPNPVVDARNCISPRPEKYIKA